jgi:tRNA(fMet)-specific endonuclease VapC
MGKLIDTSIFIEAERGRLDFDFCIAEHGDDDLLMSVITASELLHGVHRATAAHKSARRDAIEAWIERFTVLDIDLVIARTHARLFADLKSTGSVIGPHDLWLAATCLSHNLSIVTGNIREFKRVPGLEVEDWSSPA